MLDIPEGSVSPCGVLEPAGPATGPWHFLQTLVQCQLMDRLKCTMVRVFIPENYTHSKIHGFVSFFLILPESHLPANN